MAQNVNLQGHDLERSRSSMKVNNILQNNPHLSMSVHVKFHRDFIASFFGTVEQSLTERWLEERS